MLCGHTLGFPCVGSFAYHDIHTCHCPWFSMYPVTASDRLFSALICCVGCVNVYVLVYVYAYMHVYVHVYVYSYAYVYV